MEVNIEKDICCPEFDPKVWDEKTVTWKDKLFVTKPIPQIFHIPLPGVFGKAVTEMYREIEKAGATVEVKDTLMLAQDPSPWKSNLYINVTKGVPGLTNAKLSGTFLAKVFDGPYKDMGKFFKEMDQYVADKKEKILDYFVYYTYCPKCAEKYGHNYIVIFAKVK